MSKTVFYRRPDRFRRARRIGLLRKLAISMRRFGVLNSLGVTYFPC
jgi:hypothetical protein